MHILLNAKVILLCIKALNMQKWAFCMQYGAIARKSGFFVTRRTACCVTSRIGNQPPASTGFFRCHHRWPHGTGHGHQSPPSTQKSACHVRLSAVLSRLLFSREPRLYLRGMSGSFGARGGGPKRQGCGNYPSQMWMN